MASRKGFFSTTSRGSSIAASRASASALMPAQPWFRIFAKSWAQFCECRQTAEAMPTPVVLEALSRSGPKKKKRVTSGSARTNVVPKSLPFQYGYSTSSMARWSSSDTTTAPFWPFCLE